MQDQTYDDYDDTGEHVSRMERVRGVVSTLIGAMLAFALLLGLGVWFYRLGVRDAQNVPVIRASAEPTKERPDNPGGIVTPHQSITSYETVEGPTDRPATAALVQAEPPTPKPADLPMAQLPPVEVQPKPAARAPEPAPVSTPEAQPAEVSPVAEAVEATEKEPVVAAAEPKAAEVASPEPPAEIPGATDLAPSASPVAPRRPSDLRERFQAARAAPEAEAEELAARAAASPHQIQLLANPDEAVVRAEWRRIYRENEDLLNGRALAIQTTISGGTTFYRLRVGPFRDRTEAATVCQALKARRQDCIVATNS